MWSQRRLRLAAETWQTFTAIHGQQLAGFQPCNELLFALVYLNSCLEVFLDQKNHPFNPGFPAAWLSRHGSKTPATKSAASPAASHFRPCQQPGAATRSRSQGGNCHRRANQSRFCHTDPNPHGRPQLRRRSCHYAGRSVHPSSRSTKCRVSTQPVFYEW